jgi:hypothetical protein
MTRHPPHHRLDAEEHALAALLSPPHGRGEPGAKLDARILAAAQAALQPQQPPVRHPRRSWIGPTALAASLVLAIGLAWQLRPPASLPAPAATDAGSADTDEASMQAFQSPSSTPPPMARTMPMPVPPAEAMVVATPKQESSAADTATASQPGAAPPPTPPAPAAPAMVAEAAVAAPQTSEPARAQAPVMAKATASDAMRERTAASGTVAAENREDARRGADAATLDAIAVNDPEEDVPPATADAPAVRDAWLERIGELLRQGKTEDARDSLAEFQRRYPDAPLPPGLRKLEP